MSAGPGLLVVLAGAAAGGLAAVAAREAVLATPSLARWVEAALEPLRRAGREGYSPSTPERRRLAGLVSVAAIVAGWFLGGPGVANLAGGRRAGAGGRGDRLATQALPPRGRACPA